MSKARFQTITQGDIAALNRLERRGNWSPPLAKWTGTRGVRMKRGREFGLMVAELIRYKLHLYDAHAGIYGDHHSVLRFLPGRYRRCIMHTDEQPVKGARQMRREFLNGRDERQVLKDEKAYYAQQRERVSYKRSVVEIVRRTVSR